MAGHIPGVENVIARPHCLHADILHVAAAWTERSTCRLYPESKKIDLFLHISRRWTCSSFGYM